MNEVLLEATLMQIKVLENKVDTLIDRVTDLTERFEEAIYLIESENRYDGFEEVDE